MIRPSILYEDAYLLVVDKPAGVVVHPTYKNPDGTLLDMLAPGSRIVTRLDKGTSGVVVVAKSAEMHAQLQEALAQPDAEKFYLAVVRGITDERGVIAEPLASDPHDRRRRIVATHGAASLTEFERLASADEMSLLRCRLRTGRRHQIRVHLASRGWPIVGDEVYGTPLEGFPRLALHAARVAFDHPATGVHVSIASPDPEFTHLNNTFRGLFG